MEVERSGVVARRDHLHRRDVQERWKLTFAKGASLKDPEAVQPSLEGNTRRAIDFREGDEIDADALKALIQRPRL